MDGASFRVTVSAPAAIPVGDEVEVHLVRETHDNAPTERAIIRHVATSILYGMGTMFRRVVDEPLVGLPELARTPDLAPGWEVVGVRHGRVRECIVGNVVIASGGGDSYVVAAATLLVEPTPKPTAEGRG